MARRVRFTASIHFWCTHIGCQLKLQEHFFCGLVLSIVYKVFSIMLSGQAWSWAMPWECWRIERDGGNWLPGHLWCPHGQPDYGICKCNYDIFLGVNITGQITSVADIIWHHVILWIDNWFLTPIQLWRSYQGTLFFEKWQAKNWFKLVKFDCFYPLDCHIGTAPSQPMQPPGPPNIISEDFSNLSAFTLVHLRMSSSLQSKSFERFEWISSKAWYSNRRQLIMTHSWTFYLHIWHSAVLIKSLNYFEMDLLWTCESESND